MDILGIIQKIFEFIFKDSDLSRSADFEKILDQVIKDILSKAATGEENIVEVIKEKFQLQDSDFKDLKEIIEKLREEENNRINQALTQTQIPINIQINTQIVQSLGQSPENLPEEVDGKVDGLQNLRLLERGEGHIGFDRTVSERNNNIHPEEQQKYDFVLRETKNDESSDDRGKKAQGQNAVILEERKGGTAARVDVIHDDSGKGFNAIERKESSTLERGNAAEVQHEVRREKVSVSSEGQPSDLQRLDLDGGKPQDLDESSKERVLRDFNLGEGRATEEKNEAADNRRLNQVGTQSGKSAEDVEAELRAKGSDLLYAKHEVTKEQGDSKLQVDNGSVVRSDVSERVQRIKDALLDSIRISVNSLQRRAVVDTSIGGTKVFLEVHVDFSNRVYVSIATSDLALKQELSNSYDDFRRFLQENNFVLARFDLYGGEERGSGRNADVPRAFVQSFHLEEVREEKFSHGTAFANIKGRINVVA